MKKQHVQLKEEDKVTLEELIDKGASLASQYKRALALLELNRGKTFKSVAETVGVVPQTASLWAKKYLLSGLGFLTDQPRPGRPTIIDGVDRAKVTALACSDPPEGYGQWSLRLLAEKVIELEYVETISHTKVGEILKKHTQASP